MSRRTAGGQSLEAARISVDAFLADSVTSPGDGKVYVQGGGWNVLRTAILPVRQPRIGIASLIKVPYPLADNQPHRFELRLEDAHGEALALGDAPSGLPTSDGKVRRIGAEFAVGRPVGIEPGDEQVVALALNLDGIVFERAGTCVFVIDIDGEEAARLRFRVSLLVEPRLALQ